MTARVGVGLAWATLAWLGGLLLWQHSPAPGWGEGRDAAIAVGLALPALAVLWLCRAPWLTRWAGLACGVVAGWLQYQIQVAGTAAGVAAWGHQAFDGWLFCMGLACWALGRESRSGLALAWLVCMVLGPVVGAISVLMLLACWGLPGFPMGAGLWPVWTWGAMLLVTGAVVGTTQEQVRARSRASGEAGYRWMFARNMALTLGTSIAAALIVAGVMGSLAVEWWTAGWLHRVQWHAHALTQWAQRDPGMTTQQAWQQLLVEERMPASLRSAHDEPLAQYAVCRASAPGHMRCSALVPQGTAPTAAALTQWAALAATPWREGIQLVVRPEAPEGPIWVAMAPVGAQG
ncbi:MAG TPA: hypothetical protein VEQ09_09935 [Aquabacterium sp.]|nr:hypothetical protein [Aquabacterium sp.]